MRITNDPKGDHVFNRIRALLWRLTDKLKYACLDRPRLVTTDGFTYNFNDAPHVPHFGGAPEPSIIIDTPIGLDPSDVSFLAGSKIATCDLTDDELTVLRSGHIGPAEAYNYLTGVTDGKPYLGPVDELRWSDDIGTYPDGALDVTPHPRHYDVPIGA